MVKIMKYFQDDSVTNSNGVANRVAVVFAEEIELVLKKNQVKKEYFSAFCTDVTRNGFSIVQNKDIEETLVQFSEYYRVPSSNPATIEQLDALGLSEHLNLKQLQAFYSLVQQQSLVNSLVVPIFGRFAPENIPTVFDTSYFLDLTEPAAPKVRITATPKLRNTPPDYPITELGLFVITADISDITNDTILLQNTNSTNEKSDIGDIETFIRYVPKVEISLALTAKQHKVLTNISELKDLGKEISKKEWFEQNKGVVIAEIQKIHDSLEKPSDFKTHVKNYLLAIGTPEKKVDAIAGNIEANIDTPEWLAINGFHQIYEANVAKSNFLTPILGAFGFATLGATGGAAAAVTFAATTAIGTVLAPVIVPVAIGGVVVGAGALGVAAAAKVVDKNEKEKEKQKQTGNIVVM